MTRMIALKGKSALLLTALFLLFAPASSFAFRAPDMDSRLQSAFAQSSGATQSAGISVNISWQGLSKTLSGNLFQEALSFLEEIKSSYRMKDPAREFKIGKVRPDEWGHQHIRLDQTYQGIPVINSQIILHVNKDGAVYRANGQYTPDINISITPSVSPEQARQAGLSLFSEKPNLRVSREPQLVIYPVGNRHLLAYHFIVSYNDGQGDIGCWVCYLDAHTNELIQRYNEIKYVAAPSSGGADINITGARLSGEDGSTVSVQGWHETTDADTDYLYNKNRWWYIYNFAENGYTDTSTYAYRTNTSAWGNSDPVEISAAKNFYDTQDYFLAVHGRNSFDDLSTYAVGNVHYGTNYVNAFWDPESGQLSFGDGNGTEANPLTVLDIVAHEYGHAWTEYTSKLIYLNESGALNESFSDIIGANVEFYSQPDGRLAYPNSARGYADWLLGEDAWLPSGTAALRDMRNPSRYGQPSRYHGRYWYISSGDNGGVHYNSGVQNFFYYLLCEGGSGTNDGLPYSVAGIGMDNARMIAYQVNTNYLGPSETYWPTSRQWAEAALAINPAWVDSVNSAWAAVGLIDVPVSPYQDFEGATLPFGWTTGGNAAWFLTTSAKIHGSKGLRSGTINDGQSTWLQWKGYIAVAGLFSFFARISSEGGSDFLKFYINDVEQPGWSGEMPWTSYCAYLAAGPYTLRWEYVKDGTSFSGLDAAWIDAVSFSSDTIYTVNASAGLHGTINPSGAVIVPPGATPAFTITPDAGYHVSDLLVNGSSEGAITSYTFAPITEDGHTIAAFFEANPASGGGGGGGPAGPIAVGISAFLGWWKRRQKT
ncbi:MAG: M4 family metallopeptidase [Candidatus Omnitrophica bacterium]|nr:M4 family metallopeptidase [Candidatus Omnitrophota bacterium]